MAINKCIFSSIRVRDRYANLVTKWSRRSAVKFLKLITVYILFQNYGCIYIFKLKYMNIQESGPIANLVPYSLPLQVKSTLKKTAPVPARYTISHSDSISLRPRSTINSISGCHRQLHPVVVLRRTAFRTMAWTSVRSCRSL